MKQYLIKTEYYDSNMKHINSEWYSDYPDEHISKSDINFKDKFDKYVYKMDILTAKNILEKQFNNGELVKLFNGHFSKSFIKSMEC